MMPVTIQQRPARVSAIGVWIVLTTLFGALGCQPDTVPGPMTGSNAVDSAAFRAKVLGMLTQSAFQNIKVTNHGDSISYWTSSYHCETNCDNQAPNTQEIAVQLPRKAATVTVTAFGPVNCGGTLPVLRAYSKAGILLDTQSMQLTDPPDCAAGDDNMTNRMNGSVSHIGGEIDRFWIEPPSIWTWLVPNNPPSLPPLQARAFIDYTATIISPSAPPPVPDSICPPIGDQIWDSLTVRQKTLQFFDSSGAMLVPMSDVKEYLFTVYRNPDGSYRISVPFQIRKQCGVDFILPSPGFADSTLLAIVHVHPYESGQYVICPDGEEFIYDNAQYNGLSGGDGDFLSMHIASVIARANMSPRAVGVYVIDKDRIWRNPPTDSPSTRFDTNRYEPRRPAACRWY